MSLKGLILKLSTYNGGLAAVRDEANMIIAQFAEDLGRLEKLARDLKDDIDASMEFNEDLGTTASNIRLQLATAKNLTDAARGHLVQANKDLYQVKAAISAVRLMVQDAQTTLRS